MRIFVSEYLCSGAWPETVLPPSLAREGRAMLLALLADLAALPDVTLCTTWDARLGAFPLPTTALPLPREKRHSLKTRQSGERAGVRGAAKGIDPHARAEPVAPDAVAVGSPLNVACVVIVNSADESAVFERLARECDATYVIAPELDDLLTQRVQSVLDAGGRSLNASPAAIAVCSDKWEAFQRLSAAGIPTVPTALFDPDAPPPSFNFPLVLKPRFGAGSQDMFLLRDANDLSCQFSSISSQNNRKSKIENRKSIVQPYLPGRTLSVAAIFGSDDTLREFWPVGEQVLSDNGRFTYLGGRLPASPNSCLHATASDFGFRISDLITRFARAIPGCHGYIGFDLILPDDPAATPLVVDINPRLTTSYLGYRALANDNLSGRILWPDRESRPVDWRAGSIEFKADGTLVRSPAGRG